MNCSNKISWIFLKALVLSLLNLSALYSQEVAVNFSFETRYTGQGFSNTPISISGQLAYDESQLSGGGYEVVNCQLTRFRFPSINNHSYGCWDTICTIQFIDGIFRGFNLYGDAGGTALVGSQNDFTLAYRANEAQSHFALSSAYHLNHGFWAKLNSSDVSFVDLSFQKPSIPSNEVALNCDCVETAVQNCTPQQTVFPQCPCESVGPIRRFLRGGRK